MRPGVALCLGQTKYKYISGRDRVIVRALSATQQFDDPRNIFVHSAIGLGALLSAIVPFGGPSLTAATAVYNGAAVTSLDKYFRDQSGDQLNLLNDTGYTAATNAEIVVPKSGTAVRVIFVPSKQFREAWWTQACVENVPVGISHNNTFVPVGAKEAKNVPYLSATDEEVYRAAEACTYSAQKRTDELLKADHPDEGNSAVFVKAQSVKFSKWSGNALALFRDLSETLVAGTHIVEESDLDPLLTQIICPTDDQGNVSLPAASDKAAKTDVACTLIGKNLYNFARLRLRNGKDPTDATTVDASVTVTGGAGGGSATFKVSDLASLTAQAYDVFGLTEDGVEQKTTQVIHLKKSSSTDGASSATISKIDPLEIKSSGVQKLTVTGKGLKAANKLFLTDEKSHASGFEVAPDPAPTDTTVIFSVDPKTFTPPYTTDTKLTVSLKAGDNELAKTDQVVTFKAPAALAPAAAAKKPVVKNPKAKP